MQFFHSKEDKSHFGTPKTMAEWSGRINNQLYHDDCEDSDGRVRTRWLIVVQGRNHRQGRQQYDIQGTDQYDAEPGHVW